MEAVCLGTKDRIFMDVYMSFILQIRLLSLESEMLGH